MKIRLLSVLLLLLSIFCVSCQKTKQPLIIGIIKPSIDHFPLQYALENHFLDSTKVKVIKFTSGWEVQEALIAKKIDLCIMPFTFAWTAKGKGYDVKILSCFERETDGIVTSSEVKNIQELNDQPIGLLRASTVDVFMRMTAQSYGISYNPVYFRTPMEMIQALKQKEVKAIVCYVPLIEKLEPEFKVLHWFSNQFPEHACCDLVVTGNALNTKEKQIKEVYRALNKTLTFLEKNPLEAQFAVQKNYNLTAEQAISALEHTKFKLGLSEDDQKFEKIVMNEFLSMDYIKMVPMEAEIYFYLDLK